MPSRFLSLKKRTASSSSLPSSPKIRAPIPTANCTKKILINCYHYKLEEDDVIQNSTQQLFDEDNTAVREAISLAIKGAHRNGKEVGLCGQAPSDKPDFARFLVDLGIDSISLTPDAVLNALDVVSAAESEHGLQDEISKAIKGRNMNSEKETKEKDSALKA